MDYISHTLTQDGHTLVAYEYNPQASGIPVIFIHGIISTPLFFHYGIQAVCGHTVRAFSLTLPGHAPAAFPAGFSAADLSAECIVGLLNGAIRQLIGEQPFIVYGHSTGGFAALLIAATNPNVRAVMSVAGFVQGRWHGILAPYQALARMGALGQALFKLGMRSSTLSLGIFAWLGSFYATQRRAYWQHPDIRRTMTLIFPIAQTMSTVSMLAWFTAMPTTDVSAWLPRISAPVTAIAGTRDGIVPFAQSERIVAGVKQGKLIPLAGVGHLPMAEADPQYTHAVKAWVETYTTAGEG